MKAIIAGGRHVEDYQFVSYFISDNPHFNEITEIVQGGARGADAMAKRFAIEHRIPYKEFKARWMEYGKQAGTLRNIEMADYVANSGDVGILIAIPDLSSRGTYHMIRTARNHGFEIFQKIYDGPINFQE